MWQQYFINLLTRSADSQRLDVGSCSVPCLWQSWNASPKTSITPPHSAAWKMFICDSVVFQRDPIAVYVGLVFSPLRFVKDFDAGWCFWFDLLICLEFASLDFHLHTAVFNYSSCPCCLGPTSSNLLFPPGLSPLSLALEFICLETRG